MVPFALLLIDVGNSRIKWASANWRDPIRLLGEKATREISESRIQSLAKNYRTQHVVLSCVVPKLLPAFRRTFGRRLTIVRGDLPALSLRFNYPKPSELGADRLASAVAARALGRWPVIIVNCGTATAFTVLNAKGTLCGGAIAPGLQTQLQALLASTAQLPTTELRSPRQVLARTTQEAIRSGVLLSFQGGVKEIVLRLGEALQERPHVLLTGGNASYLSKVLKARVEPLLVLEGLRIIGTRLLTKTV